MSNYPDGLPAVAFCQMEGCDYTRSARCPRCGSRLRCACGRLAGHTDAWWDAHEKVCPTLNRPHPTARVTPADRFMAKIRRDGDGGCWLWTAGTIPQGYGKFWDGDQQVLAHRWSYEHFVGPIPEGLDIDHLCRNRACVNPEHLEPVTRGENMRRSPLIGRALADRTECVHGHPFDEANTRMEGRKRRCRACGKEKQRRYLERKASR